MSVTVRTLREALADCPICTYEFNYTSGIPRRMPCCGQPICEECLQTYIRARKKFSCPLCRVDVTLPGGAKSLPKDLTTLRFIDVLHTQRDAVPMCTDCPDHNTAMAKCDDCGAYLCGPCLHAHKRHSSTRNHRTSTFDDIQARRSTRPQSAARRGTNTVASSELKTKLDNITERVGKLSGIEENINKSQKRATEQINARFDDMIDELQQRRGILLSQVEAKADKERKSIRRVLESHRTLQDKLKTASTSGHSAASLLQETPEDVGADRVGVSFSEANMQQLLSTIRSAGQVRLVTFSPTQRPSRVPEDRLYDAVKFKPDESPESADADMTISTGNKTIICPHLEFDQTTSTTDVNVSSDVVSNMEPDSAPADTGCRLKSWRRALTLRPLAPRRGQLLLFSTQVRFKVKQLVGENSFLWETAVTSSPVDANWNQHTGLSVRVVSCQHHKQQLCLQVTYDNKTLTDVPLRKYQTGESINLHLCVMIDKDAKKIHVVDITDVKVVTTVTDCVFDRPLWVLMYVDPPSNSDMKSQLISGREVNVTPEIKQLLTSLI